MQKVFRFQNAPTTKSREGSITKTKSKPPVMPFKNTFVSADGKSPPITRTRVPSQSNLLEKQATRYDTNLSATTTPMQRHYGETEEFNAKIHQDQLRKYKNARKNKASSGLRTAAAEALQRVLTRASPSILGPNSQFHKVMANKTLFSVSSPPQQNKI